MDYRKKYLKYKAKYLNYRNKQNGRAIDKLSKDLMKFEIVLKPILAPHHIDNNDDQVDWFVDGDEYDIDEVSVPEDIRNLANNELLNGIGKEIVIRTLELQASTIEYTYKNNKIYLIVELGGYEGYKSWITENTVQNWIDYIEDYFGSGAADTWMSGDIIIIEKDNYDIELFLELESIRHISEKANNKGSQKDIKLRPSPTESATNFLVGTIKVGNDNNKWIIVTDKNGTKRWKLMKSNEK